MGRKGTPYKFTYSSISSMSKNDETNKNDDNVH